MSTMSAADDLETTSSLASVHPPTPYDYAVTHVFFSVELSEKNDYTLENDLSLARAVCVAAHAYSAHAEGTLQWHRITRMLDNLQASAESEHLDRGHVVSQLCGMQVGDILAFFIRPQNAAVVFTKRESCTLFESFEVSPSSDAVEKTEGSLICSYPWSAAEVPNEVFNDEHFRFELVNFLFHPYSVDSDLPLPPPAGPRYVTALLTGILRGVGHSADAPRITKCIRDHVGRWPLDHRSAKGDWRRSSLWLLIRVAIQMSVDQFPLGRTSYKQFVLFFICTLARDPNHTNLSSDLLHLMSSKIFRRLSKLGSSPPDWLSALARNACTSLQEVLDARWKTISVRPSLFRNPSQDELTRDTLLSFLDSQEYICNALANRSREPLCTSFHPSHHLRGTIEDFLSSNGSFYEEAYDADPDITLYDVEHSVEQGIDDWIARVMNVEEACTQLEILMDKYLVGACSQRGSSHHDSPENYSIMLLTAIELFVALDKLVLKEIPMLAEYSLDIPIPFLDQIHLRKTTSLHRLARAYQYILARQSRSRPGWSILSNEFTEDSFSVRYYDRSPHLQQLKARIEEDAIPAGRDDVQLPPTASVVHTYGGHQDLYHRHFASRQLAEGGEVSQSPLPVLPLYAKVVVFELYCPTCIRIWRSAAPRILHYFHEHFLDGTNKGVEDNLLAHAPALQRYFVHREGPPLHVQIYFACFCPEGSQSQNSLTSCYVLHHPDPQGKLRFSTWNPGKYYTLDPELLWNLRCRHGDDSYVHSTSHTSNDVMSAQADCPADFSLDEFIVYGHLRSGGSLQWLNILRGLRSRTLNIRRDHAHFLLAHAVSQVGPLDSNTGSWIWHQELGDSSFCNTLLDELDSLLIEVAAGSIDGVMMSTISLLLTRVLASSPSDRVSERAIALLQSARRKTFNWMQMLLYDLVMAPMNGERNDLLCRMAVTCRSTFNVDPATLHEVLRSAEDVDALLSCALLTHALHSEFTDDAYSRLLFQQDSRLASAVEEILRDVILADASDFGIDLAVGKIFASHKPSTRRWHQLQCPDTRWLTCQTEATKDQPSQTLHLDLLNGELLVDGQPLGGLPRVFRDSPKCKHIFRDQGFFLIPSNLPGMDFTTLATMSEQKVHFSLRDDYPVVRAQCDQTNDILELIPSGILRGDLPPALVDGHVHWLNLSTKLIEIRPLERLWEQSPENWRIDCASGQYRMYKGRETLVDIRSPTWAIISECFECLNNTEYLNVNDDEDLERLYKNLLVTVSPANHVQSGRLSVALPRYGLSFFVNEQEELESRDFKGMVYDEDQCVGTLFGLENLLVLRQKGHLPEALVHKRVLIPSGFPKKYGDDQVWIGTRHHHPFSRPAGNDPSHYHTYIVDTDLGCLIGNGSLTSTRYLAYLHAMTSYHRPDPLTGKTGAQAALSLLQSAGCRSVMKLKALNDANDWNSTQYPQINAAQWGIQHRYYWNRGAYESKAISASEKRAARRAAYLFLPNTARPTSPEDCDDSHYLIPGSDLELENVAFAAASAVRRWSIHAPTMDTILNWAELWSDNMNADISASPIQQDGPEVRSNPGPVQTLIIKVHDILESWEGTRQRFQLLFLLPAMAYCSPSYQSAFFSMLIAFAMQLQSPDSGDPPIISDGYRPTEEVVYRHICKSRLEEWHFGPEAAVAKHLVEDWPSDTLPMVRLDSNYWDVASLTINLKQLFSSCYRNFNLMERLTYILTGAGLSTLPRRVPSSQSICNGRTPLQITLDQLLLNRPAPELQPCRTFLFNGPKDDETSSNDIPALDQLFSSLRIDPLIQREYIAHLDASAQHLRREPQATHRVMGAHRIEALEKHYVQCRDNYMDGLATLKQSLGPTMDPYEQALERFGQWPPITADVLLRCLASTSPIEVPLHWKKCLVSLSLLLLELQRSRRLLLYALDGIEEDFLKESENEGCDGWSPEEHPDWLLIQIQGNFLIRRSQAETAMEMISPQSGENTVMQVNMGEGKSSVIIPIVAAVLADGKQVVRVIVPKALTVQMFELLVSRLGGLVNRPIYHLPFSRSPECDSFGEVISLQIDDLHKLVSQCMAERGILLVQPEHVVSLKLTSVEEQIRKGKLVPDPLPKLRKFICKHILLPKSLSDDSLVGGVLRWLSQSPSHSSKKDAAHADHHDEHSESDNALKWLSLQKWFHSHVRDILDESDEILHSRFQLVYTIGLQQYMDGYPDRWTITQHVLRLVKKHADSISRYSPDSIEYERGPPGSFPYIRIVRASDVGRDLMLSIVEDVMAGRLPTFKFRNISPALHEAIRSFISDEDMLPGTAKNVEEYAKRSHQSSLWTGLLLLRGLLACNILLFSLAERRWRVDYGLDSHSRLSFGPTSTLLAVPYRAKDVPATNTQFGHPDIAIILTCLSYYYAGLSEEQLRASFEILLDQDDPSTEYALWVKEYDRRSAPDSLQTFGEINLRSSEQWDKAIFPLFSRNQAAIDFYLSRVVLPKEAKEFPWKLSASSWDLAEKREKAITGFSGTNDSRCLLPMSIAEHDLYHQQGTNARVLAFILQPENDAYMVTHQSGKRWTIPRLLQIIVEQRPIIRVLLDVGAQILDFSNHQVAKAWLDIAPDTSGAVYFNKDDELMILTRNGITQPMRSSPLFQQLDRCVVYLDHPHMRGTDIKLPIGSRAAVTLGPEVTKDSLVQGCMRMRRLGHGHSVMFFAPLEVDRSIRAVTGKKAPNTRLDTVDILHWAIHETCTDIRQRAPYWAQQGMSHKSRYDAWSRFCDNELGPDRLSDTWLQPELKSLTDLYAPSEAKKVPSALSKLDPAIRQRCKNLGVLSLLNAQMEEEQEREVSREREREREVELPPKAKAAEHFLHQDVVNFVNTGIIPPLHSGGPFRPVFATLEESSAATSEADVWSANILATADFCKTVKPESTRGTIDQYLRPVQWILSRKNLPDHNRLLVLLSPFEADHLMPAIRASEYVHLHVYAPRTSRRMNPSDDLKLHSIPPLPSDWTPPWDLIDQLNVFAGQLYLRDHRSYLRLCRFLGAPTKASPNDSAIRWNLFNIPGSFEENEIRFSDSPLPSVMALLAIRNRGRPFAQTQMGKILQGQLLTEKDFDEPLSVVSTC